MLFTEKEGVDLMDWKVFCHVFIPSFKAAVSVRYILDDGGFLVKDRARSKAGIDLGHWETCALGLGLGRSSSLFFD